MAWPTNAEVVISTLPQSKIVRGPNAVRAFVSYISDYDEGYADGQAAGGGGGSPVPTTGQTWPRGNP